MKVKLLSHVRLFTTPWTAAHQAPLSVGFSRQEYWSGVPLPSLIYMLLCIKQITNENLLYRTGNSVLCDALNGKEILKKEGIYVYVPVRDREAWYAAVHGDCKELDVT